jgi:hypothetical protein
VLKPKIKQVANQKDNLSVMFDLIKPLANDFLSNQAFIVIGSPQMKVRSEVYFLVWPDNYFFQKQYFSSKIIFKNIKMLLFCFLM